MRWARRLRTWRDGLPPFRPFLKPAVVKILFGRPKDRLRPRPDSELGRLPDSSRDWKPRLAPGHVFHPPIGEDLKGHLIDRKGRHVRLHDVDVGGGVVDERRAEGSTGGFPDVG